VSERERAVEAGAWSAEMQAQRCAATLEAWWNLMRRRTDALEIAAAFDMGELLLGRWDTPRTLPCGVRLYTPASHGQRIPAEGWRAWVTGWAKAGWQLHAIEFRHVRFDPDPQGAPRDSDFEFSAHLVQPATSERAVLAGTLVVHWDPGNVSGQPPKPARVDASRLTLLTRTGPPPFQQTDAFALAPPEKLPAIDPLIVQDLDGDGRMELLLPAVNQVYRMSQTGRYAPSPLFAKPPGPILAAVLADADADGMPDLVVVLSEGVSICPGRAGGGFDPEARLAWEASEPLMNPMALTAGDADGDGLIDLFLGQYRAPTLGQILRPHYYEANDGYPAYLLLNAGGGRFRDATVASGIQAKRTRRTYSASWVDLDADADLDLLVVSDFAGLDAYRNDGRGHLTDVTAEWFPEPYGFGMSQTVADMNGDGIPDVLMIGMTSPTVDRLEHLNLWRADARGDRGMRARMAYGNRLFLGREGGGFAAAPPGNPIARSGWAWGAGAMDFDNDGFPDVYIANGYESQKSVRDYEPEIWLHDLHVGDDVDDAAATTYFLAKYQRTRGSGWSYGGNEKNRLYWNDGGHGFVEVGHLFGVALEEDSRCAVASDLDGDGRVDLAITTDEVWPQRQQTLRIYRNVMEPAGRWIGFRLRDAAGRASTAGARVLVEGGGRRFVRSVVCGDAFRSQQPGVIHFGLGSLEQIDRAEIRWMGGAVVELRNPALNRYHDLSQ
jgi:hypothetical protein